MNLGQQRRERRLDCPETLRDDQHPQQRRPRIPVLSLGARRFQRLLQQRGDLAGWPARQQHPHPLRNGVRFARLRDTGTQPGEHRRNPVRAARVVQAADHQLALQPGRQLLVGSVKFGQCPFDHVHRVRPPEQRRVRLGSLQRDRGTLPRVGGRHQRLLQQHERPLPSRGYLHASCFPQHPGPLTGWRRLGQCPVQQARRSLRRAGSHRCPGGFPQPRQHPAIPGWPHPLQVRGHLPRRGRIGVQQPGRAAMGAVLAGAVQ